MYRVVTLKCQPVLHHSAVSFSGPLGLMSSFLAFPRIQYPWMKDLLGVSTVAWTIIEPLLFTNWLNKTESGIFIYFVISFLPKDPLGTLFMPLGWGVGSGGISLYLNFFPPLPPWKTNFLSRPPPTHLNISKPSPPLPSPPHPSPPLPSPPLPLPYPHTASYSKLVHWWIKTSSPKGNDRSPESKVKKDRIKNNQEKVETSFSSL